MTSYIAAGTNEGDREKNLLSALERLKEIGAVTGVSPLYETPAALLFDTARDDWNKPYLNCVFQIETNKDAFSLLRDLQKIERDMGRGVHERWSPRTIDLDIIEHNGEHIDTPELTVPHKQCLKRSFVLDPLSFFKTVAPEHLYSKTHRPMIMGILNVTPDSFSDGGKNDKIDAFVKNVDEWESRHVAFVDVGAESTRPDAAPVSAAEEQNRLSAVFDYMKSRKKTPFSARFSIDTYHFETAKKALESGFDALNDIHGMRDPEMLALAREHSDKPCVFMHNDDIKSLPPAQTIPALEQWLERKMEVFLKNGLRLNNLIFDPGIGFGKTACQSLQVLQNIERFHRFGLRILIGHSRKSFMKVFTPKPPAQKDVETLAISLKIADGTDILRVHTPIEHMEALLAAAHTENQFF